MIPVPIILRDLAIARGITWDGLIDAVLALPIGRHLGKGQLLRTLEDGNALVMLDGLDEIGSVAVRRDLRNAIHEGMRRHGTCRWLMTSRVVGYEHVRFDWTAEMEASWGRDRPQGSAMVDLKSEFKAHADHQRLGIRALYVTPFDDDRIARFAKNWYDQREVDAVESEQGARNLVEAIHADPATTRLARIPNLLTIMALIHRIRARLPNGKALLYNEIAQAYLETIDDFRKLPRESNDTLADKKRWLARVGFEMQLRRTESPTEAPNTTIRLKRSSSTARRSAAGSPTPWRPLDERSTKAPPPASSTTSAAAAA